MRSRELLAGLVGGVVMGVLFSAAVVLAGSLEPSAGPTAADSQMYNLRDIYNRINNGAAATKTPIFTEPSSGPTAGTMHTLDEIYALAGLRAPVSKTGQTLCYDSLGTEILCAVTGQDGQIMAGVVWPNPRFTDNNNNGTVTDNLTGLIWLKDANCLDTVGGISKPLGTLKWADALTWSNKLSGGKCGLIDGSTAGQWRLPNVKELQSLIDWAFYDPALSNAVGIAKWMAVGDAFTNVQSNSYWSSSTVAFSTGYAWLVHLYYGSVPNALKTIMANVWPVRGGQGR